MIRRCESDSSEPRNDKMMFWLNRSPPETNDLDDLRPQPKKQDRVCEFGSGQREMSLPEGALPTRSGRGPRPRAMLLVIFLYLLLATKRNLLRKQLMPLDRSDRGWARSPRTLRAPRSRLGR